VSNLSVGRLARYAALSLGAALVLIPVGWIILSSFKSQGELFQRPPTFLPESFDLSNYTEALSQFAFLRYLRNSLIVTVGATLLTLAINSMAAFALAKYNFRGRDFLFLVTLGTIMVPLQIILIPVFLVVAQLGLVNSLWGLIIPPAATPTGVFLLRQYMLTLPDELLEAARLDGAGEWQVFWRIVLPLTWPALAVVTIFSTIWRWNDYLWPLVVVQSDEVLTLQVALARFQGELVVSWNYVLAMAVVSMLPVLIVFLIMQRQLVSGIANTGFK
jgi:alpha-1,4-digalacturonate transport system permease protein